MYELPNGYSGKLVASFDCTKEYGSDVFFKQEGVHIAESALGKYLETSNEPLNRFGYRFKLENIDKPHMMILRYPDDKRRHMMINDCFSYDLSTGVFTDGEYEVSNTVREICNIFYARTTDMTLTVTSWGKNEPAALFGFAIYELDELKESSVPKCDEFKTRRFGVQYEDPCGVSGDLGAITFEEWGDKFIEYAKHTGQNMIVQPINWYFGPYFNSKTQPSGILYWLSLPNHNQYYIASTKPDDWVSPFLDKCEEAGIDFVGGMTLLRLGNLLKNMNIDMDSIIAGKDTYNNMRCDNKVQASCNDWTTEYNPLNYEKMISEGRTAWNADGFEYIYGEKEDDFGGAPMFNPIHPEVQRQLVEYFEEISEKYGHKKAFKGVSINIWHATFIWYSSLSLGYDDYTVNLFEKETGIKVPCEANDPDRFRKRYEYLTRRNRNLWISWRCRKIHDLIIKLRDALRKHNPSLGLYLCAWNEPVKKTMFGTFNESIQYPAFVNEKDFLMEGGIDLSLFEGDEGISISVEQNQHRDRGWTNEGSELPTEESHFFHDIAYMDDSWTKPVKKISDSGAFIMDSWTEGWGNHIRMPFNEHNDNIDEALKKYKFENITFFEHTLKLNPDGFWFESQRQITSCYPTGRNYLEPFAHAVAELDPLYLLRGGLYLDKSHAREIAEYISAFTLLPAVKFNTAEGNGDPVVVRELNFKNKFYLYAVNREPYPVSVKVKLQSAGTIKDIAGSEIISDGKDEFEFVLPPFSIKAFVSCEENKVSSYDALVPEEQMKKIKALYESQIKAFEWVEESEHNIVGLETVKQQLINAFENKKVSRVRHIAKSYVGAKARELYENR